MNKEKRKGEIGVRKGSKEEGWEGGEWAERKWIHEG